jgi:hypothetical protein
MIKTNDRTLNKITCLCYKGILFDEWSEDDHGLWATICPICLGLYFDLVKNDLESHGYGNCSVKGCQNEDNDEIEMRYININSNDVAYVVVME